MQLISIFLKSLWHLAVRWQICNQLNIPRVIVPSAGSWKMPETQKGLCLFMAWFCWNIKVQHGWLCGRGPHLELKEVGKGRLKTDDLAQRFPSFFFLPKLVTILWGCNIYEFQFEKKLQKCQQNVNQSLHYYFKMFMCCVAKISTVGMLIS